MQTLRIGTRGSRLALMQTNSVVKLLRQRRPDIDFEIKIVSTAGDIDRASSLAKIGGQGVFTKQIEIALFNGEIDVAVHSAKDLPSTDTPGLLIAAVPSRGPAEDAWICPSGESFDVIRPGAIVGTSSLRRRSMLLNLRHGLVVRDVRGNIETRLAKLDDRLFDALVMACAGLERLNMGHRITARLPFDLFVPAPGQGALAVQARENDPDTVTILSQIDDSVSHRCLDIERLLLLKLDAGCAAAVGGLAQIVGKRIVLQAAVLDRDGERRLFASSTISFSDRDEVLAEAVTKSLFGQGARALIDQQHD